MSDDCPNCGKKTNSSDSRLVKDTCGHEKCRMCLLYEEQGCGVCSQLQSISFNYSGTNEQQQNASADCKEPLQLIENNLIGIDDAKAIADKKQLREKTSEKILTSTVKPKKSIDRSHIIIIPGTPERYKCTLCLKTFRNKKGKCYHDVCLTGIQPYHCSICDRTFVKKSHFEYHERVHSGYKPFKCELCSKAFPQRNKLNRHMQSHTAEKRFLCTSCGKRYSKKDDLQSHMMIHSGTMPHKCSICAKAFRVKTSLNRHMQIHSSDRPHVCNDCGKSFKDKSLLIRHKRTHGKDRPYSCAHCPKLFLSKSELRRHLSTHSDLKPFSCTFCQTVFRRKDNLNRHIRHHHHHVNDDGVEYDSCVRTQSDNKHSKKTTQKSTDLNKKQKETKDKSKKVGVAAYQVSSKDSRNQINSRIDSKGNITPVIRAPGELSNAVPVINGPIRMRKAIDRQEMPKRTVLTYTEPIPLEEAVVINQRIEEKLYPQCHSMTSNSCFYRETQPSRQAHIACISALPPLRQNYAIRANPSVSKQPGGKRLSDSNFIPPKNGTLMELKSSVPVFTSENEVQIQDNRNNKCSIDNLQIDATNCVSTIKKNATFNDSQLNFCETSNKDSETHWRRRTSENFKPYLN